MVHFPADPYLRGLLENLCGKLCHPMLHLMDSDVTAPCGAVAILPGAVTEQRHSVKGYGAQSAGELAELAKWNKLAMYVQF